MLKLIDGFRHDPPLEIRSSDLPDRHRRQQSAFKFFLIKFWKGRYGSGHSPQVSGGATLRQAGRHAC